VRIEHPQALINRIQYGAAAEHPRLPNAPYRLPRRSRAAGVSAFACVRGMDRPGLDRPRARGQRHELSRRSSPHRQFRPGRGDRASDWQRAGFSGPLGGVELQRRIERAAFAPARRAPRAGRSRQRFRRSRASSTVPESSYIPGSWRRPLDEVLDAAGVPIAQRLRAALGAFARKMPGYLSDEAVLVGVESRTSAPCASSAIPDSLEALGLHGLYPSGEGAATPAASSARRSMACASPKPWRARSADAAHATASSGASQHDLVISAVRAKAHWRTPVTGAVADVDERATETRQARDHRLLQPHHQAPRPESDRRGVPRQLQSDAVLDRSNTARGWCASSTSSRLGSRPRVARARSAPWPLPNWCAW
jgi:hypothetical protein